MKITITSATDPRSFREIRELRNRGKLNNFKVYEITEYGNGHKFRGYTNIYTYIYNDKYYISLDILNEIYKRGGERRSHVHKSFEDKEQANDYFREITKGKEWEKVQG